MKYTDERTGITYDSFLHYQNSVNDKYNSFKAALSFLHSFSKKYTQNNFDTAIQSLDFNKDCLNTNEKEKLSILKDISLKNNLTSIYKAFKFLVHFSKQYTNSNLYKAMESLQFNQDCLRPSEKKHFFVLMSIR